MEISTHKKVIHLLEDGELDSLQKEDSPPIQFYLNASKIPIEQALSEFLIFYFSLDNFEEVSVKFLKEYYPSFPEINKRIKEFIRDFKNYNPSTFIPEIKRKIKEYYSTFLEGGVRDVSVDEDILTSVRNFSHFNKFVDTKSIFSNPHVISGYISTEGDITTENPEVDTHPPAFKFDEIKHKTDWTSKKIPSATHWGQRKLFFETFHFISLYASTEKRNVVIYPGAAGGTNIKIVADFFPNVYFVLIDPARFSIRPQHNIEIVSGYFTDEMCLYYKKKYNGSNILLISDVRSFDSDMFESASEAKLQSIIIGDNLLQEKWVQLLQPNAASLKFKLPYPISGTISLSDSPQRGETSPRKKVDSPQREETSPRKKVDSPQRGENSPRKKVDSPSRNNVSPSRNNVSPSRNNVSPSKRRIIFDPEFEKLIEPLEIRFGKKIFSHDRRKFSFLDGEIYLQQWAPSGSTETRLIVTSPLSRKGWDWLSYDRKMSYFNQKMRCKEYEMKEEYLLFSQGLDRCGDCKSEVVILENYITSNYYTFSKIEKRLQSRFGRYYSLKKRHSSESRISTENLSSSPIRDLIPEGVLTEKVINLSHYISMLLYRDSKGLDNVFLAAKRKIKQTVKHSANAKNPNIISKK